MKVTLVACDEWNVQGNGYRRDEQVESAGLGVASHGADVGAQRAVDAGGALIERDRIEGCRDPVVALFAGRIQQRILSVQTMGQLGQRDRADSSRGCVRGSSEWVSILAK